nr:50S ribosomal protein L30 [Candidatus Sigynarchaeota archaeon]
MGKKESQSAVAAQVVEAPKVHAKDLKDVLLVAIRIRGEAKKAHWVLKTMELLRLHKKHHAVLLWATSDVNGMLFKIKDFIAYGTVTKETLVDLLKKKGKLTGRRPLDEASMKNLTGYASFEDLADALLKFEVKYADINKQIVPVFRLHPARGGFFKGIKVQSQVGGSLGFYPNGIDKLLERMV